MVASGFLLDIREQTVTDFTLTHHIWGHLPEAAPVLRPTGDATNLFPFYEKKINKAQRSPCPEPLQVRDTAPVPPDFGLMFSLLSGLQEERALMQNQQSHPEQPSNHIHICWSCDRYRQRCVLQTL